MDFATNYTEVKSMSPISLRGMAREFALTGLSLKTKFKKSIQLFEKPRVQFLYIHHVFDDELIKFDLLLNELSKHHTFISYSDGIQKILTNSIDKPYISISSDDGFKNNLKAAKVLDKYNAKACFFINPDTIALNDFKKNKDFCNATLNFPPTEFMNWADVDLLLKNGHEIGSHTMGHINVANTDIRVVEDNLNESYQTIKSKCGEVNHFAFPYGRFFHFNQEAFDLVFNVGYKSCATAERGCHISQKEILTTDLFIRRDHVVCDWSLNHIMYFILNNSKNAHFNNNYTPYS